METLSDSSNLVAQSRDARRPAVSVIMPCYNSAAFIEQGVRSVLAQTFPDFELIVVNDGSNDGSLDVLSTIRNPRLRVITQPNLGVQAARNRGIRAASGEFIAFLDADDRWHKQFIENMLGAMRACPDAGLAYCGWQNVGLPGRRAEPFIPPDYEGFEKVEKLLWDCRWPIHAVVVKRELVEAAGCFDEAFRTSEDYWLWLRIAPQNPLVRVPKVLSYYYHHGNQRSTARNLLQRGMDRWHIRRAFVSRYPEYIAHLSRSRIRELTHGRLLEWGFKCYWQRELPAAHAIFRQVMWKVYGRPKDWLYMLPALLPLGLYERLISFSEWVKRRRSDCAKQ